MSADNRSALTPTWALSRSPDEGVDVFVECILVCPCDPLRGLSVLLGRDRGFDSEWRSKLER